MQALEGLRVIDMATVLAGPGAARYLADFGADVIKVESPDGDGLRDLGWRDPSDGEGLWWKFVGRGKRTVVLDLKTDDGLTHMRRLVDGADVLVENFRPGTLERLGLAPEDLIARNPGLVVLRVTGFGQDGPYAGRPGFATLAEAMSGFAAMNGEPDRRPLLPPIALTDEIAAVVGAFAVMVALRHRDRTGEGQVIDVNLLESMLQCMGALPSVWAHRGELQPRLGSGIPYTVPRGTYRCAGRMEHRDELEGALAGWIAARPSADVLAAFEAAHAAAAPVYTMADLARDPHVQERGVLMEVDRVVMPGPVARLSRTPGRIAGAGRPLGADTEEVLSKKARPEEVE